MHIHYAYIYIFMCWYVGKAMTKICIIMPPRNKAEEEGEAETLKYA